MNNENIQDVLIDYFNKKDFVGLINYCNTQIKIDNSNFLLFGAKGRALIEMKQYNNAILFISQAIELNPHYGIGFYNRGVSYYFIDEFELAIKDLENAQLLNKELSYGNYFIAACYSHMENYEKAIEIFSDYLLEYNDDNEVLQWRAELYELTEQYEKANADVFNLLTNDVENIEHYREINKGSSSEPYTSAGDKRIFSIIEHGFQPLNDEALSGVYILEFTNSEYYVGQSTKIKSRIKHHLNRYKDIKQVLFKPVPESLLLEEETQTIATLEAQGYKIRNLKQIDFANIFSESRQQKWINDLSYNISEGIKFKNEEVREQFKERYLLLEQKRYFNEFVDLLKRYIKLTIPNYIASEYNYWSITCLPNYLKESNIISRININSVPVLSVFEESDETLLFMLYVSKLPFLEALKQNKNLVSYIENLPSLRIRHSNAFIDQTDGGELVLIMHQNDFDNVLQNKLLLSSMRLFNLRMMNKVGKEEKYRRSVRHCLDLADRILKD